MFNKKQKVLILGDSFATIEGSLTGKSWTKLLEINDRYQVTNLAEGSSSLWFSFKNFLDQQKKYNKIVFVVTEPNRLYFPISKKGPAHHTIGTLGYLSELKQKLKKIDKNHIDLEKIEAVELYFKYILDTEERSIYQKLLIKEIRETRPDTILIPAFSDSIFDYQGDCLADITDRETQHFGLSIHDHNRFKKYMDYRACHLIDENNQILYEHVLRWLNGEPVTINKEDFVVMQKKDRSNYFVKYKKND